MIFSAPDTKVTRAAQLDGRAQRAQDAPPRVRRLCAITQAWLHRGDASEVFLLEDSRKPHHRPFIAALSHSCGGVDRFTRMRHERPEGLLVICFQNGCHRRAAKVKLILMIAEAEAYCIESFSRSSRRLADLGDGVSAYAAAAQTRGYDPNRPETSGTVAQAELDSFALEQGDGSRE